ncbi:MAG: hypothetical protein IMZ50_09175, partial [Candidatus Atribacteria bacterium]|nr:hypothetical protein [Candidatus Atribacteria bacterium]
MKKLTTILLLLFSLYGVAYADTHAAATCENKAGQLDVQTAVDLAASGDTVTVPAGSCTWDTQLTIGAGITLQGVDTPVITSAVGTGVKLIVYTAPGVTTFRITGFTFDINANSSGIKTTYESSTSTNIRIDHNSFLNCLFADSNTVIYIDGTFQGIVDNNVFTGYPHIDNYGNGAGGTTSWDATTFSFGSAQNIYFEDNTFTADSPTGVY